jgi:hypothetical protein
LALVADVEWPPDASPGIGIEAIAGELSIGDSELE